MPSPVSRLQILRRALDVDGIEFFGGSPQKFSLIGLALS
jgi:hypothetical protein